LRVEFRGEPIVGADVVAVQVAVWNRGRVSIRAEHVLQGAKLVLDGAPKILAASLVRQTRDVVQFEVGQREEDFRTGRVPVRWRILERGDGVIVQVIYAGAPEIPVHLETIIEGQGQAREVKKTESTQVPRVEQWSRRGTIGAAIAFTVLAVILSAFVLYQGASLRKKPWGVILGLWFIACLLWLVLAAEPAPPFDF
jgi:hypothetical protein